MRRVDWLGHYSHGQLTMPDRAGFMRTVREVFGDKDGPVRFRVEQPTRSNAQNRYWWGVILKYISEATGFTPEECHAIVKAMFLKHKYVIGDVEIDAVLSTADLATDEFNELCENARRWAAEFLHINIPEPNEG